MPERKVKLSWGELEELLQAKKQLLPEEEIREITLVKPRTLLIHLER